MKKTLYTLLLCGAINVGCKKEFVEQIISGPLTATIVDGNRISLVKDTTILSGSVWDLKGQVFNDDMGAHVHGTGTITNGIIDAGITQNVFDTSINFTNIKTWNGWWSTAWYGTLPTNADNWWNIQKSMNVSMNNHLSCVTPGNGVYKYSKPLQIVSVVNNAYQQCSLHFYGDASYWDNGLGTSFQYTGTTGPAFNMQLNKGSELDHVVFYGPWISPGGVDSVYYNTTEANYQDASGKHISEYTAGVAIDWYPPINGTTRSGSTGCYIHEVSTEGFGMGVAFSQNGITQNDDNMTLDHIYFLNNHKYGIVNGQAQEKGNSVNHLYSWGSIYNVVLMGLHGNYQAGDYSFDVANIAGRCIEPLHFSISRWFSSSINNWFCESIRDVGNFSAQQPITISNSNFDLTTTISKNRIAITSNSNYVSFTGCTIRYYDGIGADIKVRSTATFVNDSYYLNNLLLNQ